MTGSHNALVVPMSEGYAVSCSCGWGGEMHDASESAEREARGHESDPDSPQIAMPPSGGTIDRAGRFGL